MGGYRGISNGACVRCTTKPLASFPETERRKLADPGVNRDTYVRAASS